jgi:heme-degrading monooxygenase HmoA
MLARVARYEVDSERIDDAVQAFGEAAAMIQGQDGFAGGYVLVDYEDGRTMTVTLWENQAAADSSESVARTARTNAANAVGGSVLSVERFEVAQELTARPSSV